MSETLKTLSRSSVTEARDDQRGQFLAFTLGGETFAMDIRFIKEVIQYGSLTEIPLAPAFIRGVINLRGSVVPVIDLSARFGKPSTEVSRQTCIVILEVPHAEGELCIGVIVDHVSEVMDIGDSEIVSPPAFGNSIRSDFIFGIGKVAGSFLVLLNAERVLDIHELAGSSHVEERATA